VRRKTCEKKNLREEKANLRDGCKNEKRTKTHIAEKKILVNK